MVKVEKKSKDKFFVVVEEEGSKREYNVELDDQYYQLLTAVKITKEDLIKKSFQFLLEREPKESIIAEFNLRVIENYFPEYRNKIKEE